MNTADIELIRGKILAPVYINCVSKRIALWLAKNNSVDAGKINDYENEYQEASTNLMAAVSELSLSPEASVRLLNLGMKFYELQLTIQGRSDN